MAPNQSRYEDPDFDRLVRQASWPEPSAEQIARLAAEWHTISRRRRRNVGYSVAAMAACLALLATALVLRQSEPSDDRTGKLVHGKGTGRIIAELEQPSPAAPNARSQIAEMQTAKTQAASGCPEPPDVVASTNPPAPSESAEARSRGDARFEPREPTAYERIVLATATANRRRAQRRQVETAVWEKKGVETKKRPSALEELITGLVADPQTDVGEQWAAVENHIERFEPKLWEIADEGNPQRRLAAAQVIARIGTAQSLPVLEGMLGDPALHQCAIAGMCRLADSSELARLVVAESDEELRQLLFGTLLERRTMESIGLFLELVSSLRFRGDALTTASAMADPPVDVLIAFLQHPEQRMRLAAAEALGSLPQADIASRLGESVHRGVGRQEAIMALLLSPEAQSARFLNALRQDVGMAALIFAAQQQLRSLTLTER
ncbi:MAG TPA: hypothetical protein VMF30_02050 [Pirellulales bacterium]|nr:hypothetical protein [Pirellulales bacterium]